MSATSIKAALRTVWREGLRPGSPAALSLAVLGAALATLVRIGLGQIYADLVPFATYYPAILFVTFVGRVAAGTVTLALSGIMAWWLFISPQYTFFPIATNDAINLSIFTLVGGVIIWTAENLRRTRQQLMQNLEAASQLTAIVSYSGDAIVGFGLDRTIKSWNAGAERLFGYRADEIIGQPLGALVPPDKVDEPKRLFPRSSSGELLHWETVRMGKAGRRIHVSISTGPIRSPNGEITGVSAIFQDITDRKQREEHINFVMRELSHRAKNLLAVIQAIARQTGRQSTSITDFEQRFAARLQSLAHSHDILLKREWRGATLDELVTSQLEPFADAGSRVTAKGPELLLPPRTVEQIGIAMHELATNAVKHGALSVPAGSVSVSWAIEADDAGVQRLRIEWQERGGPTVTPPTKEGFGHAVLKRLVPTTLEGTATLHYPPGGIVWTVTVPAAEVIQLGHGSAGPAIARQHAMGHGVP
jgi:PAS domain S-box-containing protein